MIAQYNIYIYVSSWQWSTFGSAVPRTPTSTEQHHSDNQHPTSPTAGSQKHLPVVTTQRPSKTSRNQGRRPYQFYTLPPLGGGYHATQRTPPTSTPHVKGNADYRFPNPLYRPYVDTAYKYASIWAYCMVSYELKEYPAGAIFSRGQNSYSYTYACLLYTSDAADE